LITDEQTTLEFCEQSIAYFKKATHLPAAQREELLRIYSWTAAQLEISGCANVAELRRYLGMPPENTKKGAAN
jgi:hypothetical protein